MGRQVLPTFFVYKIGFCLTKLNFVYRIKFCLRRNFFIFLFFFYFLFFIFYFFYFFIFFYFFFYIFSVQNNFGPRQNSILFTVLNFVRQKSIPS